MVAVTETLRRAEVMRLLDRYLVEVVERYQLCPWARATRQGGELAVEILWGTPTLDAWTATARELLARPSTRVAMVIAPELEVTASQLHTIRGQVSERVQIAGIAEFHPEAALDLATPARLVPFIRRSPDPLLQLVPMSLIESIRAAPATVDRLHQAQLLGGTMAAPRPDPGDRIAEANHAAVSAAHAEITRTFEDIAADRRRSYDRVGISGSR